MKNPKKEHDLPDIRSDLSGSLSFLRLVGQFLELYVTNTGQVVLGMAKCFKSEEEGEE